LQLPKRYWEGRGEKGAGIPRGKGREREAHGNPRAGRIEPKA